MEFSPEILARRRVLEGDAPIRSRTCWAPAEWNGRRALLLCGTLGAEFDTWQRRVSVTSAADAYLAQLIGLDAIERTMDALEATLRADTERQGLRLRPRRSPGYGDMPLALSREIIQRLDATRLIGVSVTAADLLVPSKSVTAVCEIGGEGDV